MQLMQFNPYTGRRIHRRFVTNTVSNRLVTSNKPSRNDDVDEDVLDPDIAQRVMTALRDTLGSIEKLMARDVEEEVENREDDEDDEDEAVKAMTAGRSSRNASRDQSSLAFLERKLGRIPTTQELLVQKRKDSKRR